MGKRSEKRKRKAKKIKVELDGIISFLESIYKRQIKYTCIHCLNHAYRCEKENTSGYVTDEDLIESSNYKLKHN